MREKIQHEFHKHIDNGGVTVTVEVGKDGEVSVGIAGAYYGYPSVESTLSGCGLESEDLRSIGAMFIRVAEEMDANGE